MIQYTVLCLTQLFQLILNIMFIILYIPDDKFSICVFYQDNIIGYIDGTEAATILNLRSCVAGKRLSYCIWLLHWAEYKPYIFSKFQLHKLRF